MSQRIGCFVLLPCVLLARSEVLGTYTSEVSQRITMRDRNLPEHRIGRTDTRTITVLQLIITRILMPARMARTQTRIINSIPTE